MKWECFELASTDERAIAQILENLTLGGSGHTLSAKIQARYPDLVGPKAVLAYNLIDLQQLNSFSYVSYDGGKVWEDAAGGEGIEAGRNTLDALVSFIQKYLQAGPNAMVLCENAMMTRRGLESSRFRSTLDSKHLFFEQEVFHFLTSADTDPELIASTIRESSHHWATAVCSSISESLSNSDSITDALLETIVDNAAFAFFPAFDDEGYLIWSPASKSICTMLE